MGLKEIFANMKARNARDREIKLAQERAYFEEKKNQASIVGRKRAQIEAQRRIQAFSSGQRSGILGGFAKVINNAGENLYGRGNNSSLVFGEAPIRKGKKRRKADNGFFDVMGSGGL